MNNKKTNLGSMKSPLIFRDAVAIKYGMFNSTEFELNNYSKIFASGWDFYKVHWHLTQS